MGDKNSSNSYTLSCHCNVASHRHFKHSLPLCVLNTGITASGARDIAEAAEG